MNVAWWTHKIRGLHRNDFIMAAQTDALFAARDSRRRSGFATAAPALGV